MTAFASRPYLGGDDIQTLVRFARECTAARRPALTYWNPGDIAWQLGMFPPGADFRGHVRVWEDAIGVAALAIFEPPLNFAFDVHPRISPDTSLAQNVLDWVEECRRAILGSEGVVPIAYRTLGESTLSTEALESDAARIQLLESRGYRRVERHSVRYARSLDEPLSEPLLPAGMRFRNATEADIEARAELHRDAWSVWGPSSFSAARYRRLRAQSLYDEALDVVIEDADGRLVSYCICWFDAANHIGHFEPVGTRPSQAGKGLGRATILEGLRRLQQRGATTALIGTASVNAAALKCYAACRFQLVERAYLYSKHI